MSRTFTSVLSLAIIMVPGALQAAVNYQIDDGTAEKTLGIDSGEDQIWFNTFPVQAGGELITAVSVAFSRPGLEFFIMDGYAVRALVYEDPDGGSPVNATLLSSADGFIESSATNTLVRYPVPPVVVHGNLVVGILFRNRSSELLPVAGVDTAAPTFAGRSWAGWTLFGLDESNLASIPTDQFRTLEGFGLNGNFLLRGEGQPIPEPSSALGAALALAGLVRLPARLPRRRPRPG